MHPGLKILPKLFAPLPHDHNPADGSAILPEPERGPLLDLVSRLLAYTQPELEDAHLIPRSGPVLLVGNHGFLGVDSAGLYPLLASHTGRFPRGLADRLLFERPVVERFVPRIGAVPGTQDNAAALLNAGEMVLVYPGGVDDSFKGPERRYQLQWQRRQGFVRLAIATGAPIVPVLCAGADSAFYYLFRDKVLFRRLYGKGNARYDFPFYVGLGILPLPVKFLYRAGRPIRPPPPSALDNPAAVDAFHREVWQTCQRQLDRLVLDWQSMRLAS